MVMIEASTQPVSVPRRIRVLLIDDAISQRDLYEAVLTAQFEVLTAARGEDGLRLAIQAGPDAIVLDVKMPGLDGWETCRQLKSGHATADIPVILLTGADDVEDLAGQAIRVGATTLMKKPCSADRLTETIRSCVHDRQTSID
jgi:DNA-binding response OmpR family regulator